MDTHILLVKRPFSNLTIASRKLAPKIIVRVSLSSMPFPEQIPRPTIARNIHCSSILVGYFQQRTRLLIRLSFNIRPFCAQCFISYLERYVMTHCQQCMFVNRI